MSRPPVKLIRYTMNIAGSAKRYHRMNHCRKCEKGFKLNELVVSKRTSCRTAYYHKRCAEKVNLWDSAYTIPEKIRRPVKKINQSEYRIAKRIVAKYEKQLELKKQLTEPLEACK